MFETEMRVSVFCCKKFCNFVHCIAIFVQIPYNIQRKELVVWQELPLILVLEWILN